MSRVLARVMSGTLEKNSSSLVGKLFFCGDAVVLDFSPGVCSCHLLISKKYTYSECFKSLYQGGWSFKLL